MEREDVVECMSFVSAFLLLSFLGVSFWEVNGGSSKEFRVSRVMELWSIERVISSG